MKAPARLGGAAPRAPSPLVPASSAPDHRWRRALLRAAGIVALILVAFAAMALLDRAEGDLRQVRAPSFEPAVTAVA
ncbi:hypothetical protein [Roseateles aquatilis]|uniref:hypothetical protein n=1 Tax=Roseateles aquatilis TaxID=431061 RepID=UPI001131093A|nr:hypothetical protein [Roseateles aquatilis]